MKNIYTFVLTLFLGAAPFFAHAQGFEWAVQMEGVTAAAANSNSFDVETDLQGNVYIAGTFVGKVKFGSQILESGGIVPGILPDGFIAKFSANGTFQWVETIPASLDAKVHDIELDEAGNIYLAVSIHGTASIAGSAVGEEGDAGIVIAKLNADRELQWMQSFVSESNNEPVFLHSLELGAGNDLYVSGQFEGDMNLGGAALDAGSITQFFLARLSLDGEVFWATKLGNVLLLDLGSDVATDPASNVYFTASTIGVSTFDAITIDAADERTFVLAKYDSTGSIQWLRHSNGEVNLEDRGEAVAVHPETWEVYVTGTFISDTFELAGDLTSIQLIHSASFRQDFFIAKFSQTGEILWAKQSHGPAPQTVGRDIEVGADGSAFVTGIYGQPGAGGVNELSSTFGEGGQAVLLQNGGYLDIFLAKYSSAGHLFWAKKASGTEADYVTGLALVGTEDAAITGTFNETFTIGNQTLTAAPTLATDNMFVARCKGETSGTENTDAPIAKLLLSPNPASQVIRVQIESEVVLKGDVELLDETGKVLQSKPINQEALELFVTGLPNGLYFVRLSTKSGSITEKFILEH